MKNYIILCFAICIIYSSCGRDEFPAQECFIRYTIDNVTYEADSLSDYVSSISEKATIYQDFDGSARITMIIHDFNESEGDFDTFIQIYNQAGNQYSLGSGSSTITEFGDNYFKGTFVDEGGFITNSSFTLRYSQF